MEEFLKFLKSLFLGSCRRCGKGYWRSHEVITYSKSNEYTLWTGKRKKADFKDEVQYVECCFCGFKHKRWTSTKSEPY